jgi:hypothetical protein
MTKTREKLNEAKYFLTQMTSQVDNRETFRYCLSAFLAASRSVTYIMQKEFGKVRGFADWYESKRREMEKDLLMKLMKEKRDVTIHQVLINAKRDMKVTINASVVFTDEIVAVIKRRDGTEERKKYRDEKPSSSSKPKDNVEVEYRWYFDDFPSPPFDIITLSENHVAKLDSLVSECKKAFLPKDAVK